MPRKYVNITDKVLENNLLLLKNDFVQSTNPDKHIIVRKVRLINSNGQLDVGCCLCGDFAEDSSYSYGLIDDFIICSNEINEKDIHVHNLNNNKLYYWFCDYKGNRLTSDDDYYFTLELELIY